MVLSATNSFTGTTTISAGTLGLGNATDTLSNSGAVAVNGGTLSLGSNSDTVGAVTLTSGSITGTTGVLTGTSYDVREGSISAILGGTGVLTKATSGTVTLSGANTFSGGTTISGGVLSTTVLANGGTASGIGQSSNAASNLVFGDSTATLRYTGTANVTTNRGFTLSSGAGGGATIQSSGTGTLAFDNTVAINYGTADETRALTLGGTNTGANTFGKVIANNGTGATSLVKTDAGRWVLSQTNDYTGSTTVSGGTLALSSTGSINKTPTITVNSGASFDVSAVAGGYTVGSLSTDAQTLQGTGTVVGSVFIGQNGTIRGDAGNGTGDLNLNSTTTVVAGPAGRGTLATSLAVDSNGAITDNSKLLLSGATTDLNFDSISASNKFTIRLLNDAALTNGQEYNVVLATAAAGSNFLRNGSGTAAFTAADFDLVGSSGYEFTNVSLNRTGNDLVLTFTPVPEPTTILGVAVGLVAVGGFIRKRLAKKATVAA